MNRLLRELVHELVLEHHGTQRIGFFYDKGRGTSADPALAAENYRIAAAGGRNYARWRLGVMIDTGEAEGDLEEAVALFSAAADDGYTNAMTSLAVMHATGRGTPVDYEASLESYMRAARLGDGHGIQGVGVLFARGEGVPRDFTEASAWFMVGVMVGNEVAQDNLMAMFQHMNDEEKAAAVARANEIAAEFGIDSDIAYDPDFVPPSKHETK